MHGPVWINPDVEQRVSLLRLRSRFEQIEADRWRAVVIQHEGTAENSAFLELEPLQIGDWKWIGEYWGPPPGADGLPPGYAIGDEIRKRKVYRRFYLLSATPRSVSDLIAKAGSLIGDWTIPAGIPRRTRQFPIPGSVWLGVLYDIFTNLKIAPGWWIPGGAFKEPLIEGT